jgi:hypothetical protein
MRTTLKTTRRYIFYRAYAIVAILAWNVVGIYGFVRNQDPRLLLPLIPFVLPALFLGFNLMAFKFSFSVFGSQERTRPPTCEPLESARYTSGIVGILHATAPFFSWFVYREGLAFKALGIGTGFIPAVHIRGTKRRLFGGVTVSHDSPEVRSPLVIPSKALHQALIQVLARPTSPS